MIIGVSILEYRGKNYMDVASDRKSERALRAVIKGKEVVKRSRGSFDDRGVSECRVNAFLGRDPLARYYKNAYVRACKGTLIYLLPIILFFTNQPARFVRRYNSTFISCNSKRGCDSLHTSVNPDRERSLVTN